MAGVCVHAALDVSLLLKDSLSSCHLLWDILMHRCVSTANLFSIRFSFRFFLFYSFLFASGMSVIHLWHNNTAGSVEAWGSTDDVSTWGNNVSACSDDMSEILEVLHQIPSRSYQNIIKTETCDLLHINAPCRVKHGGVYNAKQRENVTDWPGNTNTKALI